MSILDNLKRGIIFPTKIKYLSVLIILSLIGIFYIDKFLIDAIRTFGIGLIAVVAFFQVTAVLTGVLGRLKIASGELEKELMAKINESIDNEHKAKTVKDKKQYYFDRGTLYGIAEEMNLEKFRMAILRAFFFLILSVFISLFEFDTPLIVNRTTEQGTFVFWQLSSWHISFAFLIAGIYFIAKLILFYDEMIRKGEFLKHEEKVVVS